MSTTTNPPKARVFEPVILFHDHVYYKEGSNHLEHTHIPSNDPHYISLIEKHKEKMQRMLDINGKLWIDQSQDDTMTLPSSLDSFLLPLPTTSDQRASSMPSPTSSPVPTTIMSTPLPSTLYSPLPATMNTSSSSRPRRCSVTTHEHRRIRTSSFNGLSTSSSTNTNTSSHNRKRRGNLPKAVTTVLRDWLADHKRHPYPTDEEKLYLSQQTNLTLNQVSNWFINARRRILIPMLEEDTSSTLTASY